MVRGAALALERRGAVEVVRLAPPDGVSVRAWRRGALARASRELRLVGVHSFVSAFPLRGAGARVQTIHELPWRHGARENADLAHRLWAKLGPLRANRVVCGTGHAARDVRAYALGGAQRVRAIAWGVDACFAPDPPAGAVDEVVLGRYRLPEDPLALCLGATREKKDLAAFLHGLADLHRRGGRALHAVVTGPETPALRRDLALANRLGLARFVSWIESVDEDDLPALMRLASVVAVLSRSEGFGLPALEALASGTPAVVRAQSAQAEVAGDAGFAVDPADPSAVADALERALNEREVLRHRLPDRARAFTWDAWAEAVEGLWRELAAARPGARQ